RFFHLAPSFTLYFPAIYFRNRANEYTCQKDGNSPTRKLSPQCRGKTDLEAHQKRGKHTLAPCFATHTFTVSFLFYFILRNPTRQNRSKRKICSHRATAVPME